MTTEESFELFFNHRYLITDIVQKYNNLKYDIDKLLDDGTDSLMNAVYSAEKKQIDINDFKIYATFCIKSAINEYLNENT